MCRSSPHRVRELDAAWAVCYQELSREAKRSRFPSHSEKCPWWHNQGLWQNSLLLPILGFVENVNLQDN